MRLVSWNCNGALRKKHQLVDELNADILIIQECENPKESTESYREWAGEHLWTGKSKHKGIGVFSKHNHTLSHCKWDGEYNVEGLSPGHPALRWKTSDLELFLPCESNNGITLLAVWTRLAGSSIFGYIGQFWKYLQIHRQDISASKCIIIGDLNSNSTWDKPDRWWNHSDVVNELRNIGMESLYHFQHKEEHGIESLPTFFMHRNTERPYHIDYTFMPNDLLNQSIVKIGSKTEWLSLSDHLPLIIDINILD